MSALIRIIKDWDWPDLMRQSPGAKGVWGNCRFTLDDTPACDFAVVLNNRLTRDVQVACAPENVWMMVQEPYEPGFTDWVVSGHATFARVYTHLDHGADPKYRRSQTALAWHVNKDFDTLAALQEPPPKSRSVSWVVGGARDLPGHFERWRLLEALRDKPGLVDLYGKKIRPIEDKWDALAPYRYSLAVENNQNPDMWTEKIADCLLAWTIPLYHGCTNLEDYFPAEAFIKLPLHSPRDAVRLIAETVQRDDWERRLPALKEARERILNRYQLFPFLANEVSRATMAPSRKQAITIPAYHPDARARWNRKLFKIKREWHRGWIKLRQTKFFRPS